MSTHTLVIPPAEHGEEDFAYADQLVIDEGGIDLKSGGETVISASFDKLDPFQLAYEVLPETYILPADLTGPEDEESIQALSVMVEEVTDEELEYSARLFLTALARRNGYEK